MGVTQRRIRQRIVPQALEFDDTHNESIVHMSSPSVAAVLALSETREVTGRNAILAIAISSEIACRVGVVAPGQFHRRGFHPTGHRIVVLHEGRKTAEFDLGVRRGTDPQRLLRTGGMPLVSD